MKYRKKPVIIEAFQYNGDLKGSDGQYYVPDWAVHAFEENVMYYDSFDAATPPCELFIKTLEGVHHVSVGNYVIKGVRGELYPCKPDIFEETYEVIEEQITEQKKAFETLDLYRRKLTIQQYKTLKGQIEAGDTEGFYKGIRKIFKIKGKSYDETESSRE